VLLFPAGLFTAFQKQETSGGFAYLGGTYYCKEYAQMIAERYRQLNFFCTVDEVSGGE